MSAGHKDAMYMTLSVWVMAEGLKITRTYRGLMGVTVPLSFHSM